MALSGQPRALDIDGNIAYVLCTDRLISVDITDLEFLVVLDEVSIGGTNCTDIEVRGNFAYITREQGITNSDLYLVNIADPTDLGTPTSIYHSNSYQFRALDLEGNVIYIACRSELISLDISDPSSASFISSCNGCSYSKDIEVDGNYAYVSGNATYVFDVTDPSSMSYEATTSGGTIWSIAIDGDFLFEANYSNGLRIWDITDPTSPSMLSSTPISKVNPCGVVEMGDWCYVTSLVPTDPSIGVIDAFDIEDPTSPDNVDEGANVPLFKAHKHGETWILAVSGSATYKYLTSIKVGYVDPNLLTEYINYWYTAYPDANGQIPPSQVKVRGNWAIVSDSTGMHWIDIEDPQTPHGSALNWGWFEESEDAIFYGLDVSGNTIFLTSSAYINDAYGGLWTLDGANPPSGPTWSPSWVGHSLPDDSEYTGHYGNIGEVEVDGNVAYVFGMDDEYWVSAATRDRLFLDSYSVSDPTSPFALDSRLATSYNGRCRYSRERMGVIEVVGDSVYTSVRIVPYSPFDGWEGSTNSMLDNHIHLFDIETPTALFAFLGREGYNIGYQMDHGDAGGDIDIEGNILYSLTCNHDYGGPPVGINEYGLFSISYSIENSLGPLTTGGTWFNSTWEDWDFLWWDNPPGGVPFHDGPHPLDLIIDGDYGFASAGDIDFYPREGLWFLNVSQPDAMTQSKISYFENIPRTTTCKAKINGMDIAGDYLYAVGTVSYKPLYEHRFWTIKVYERNHRMGGLAKRIANSNNLPENLTMSALPNPFNSAVSLTINLPNDTELSLKIIDLTGREVEKIANGKYTSGNHSFVWNADNNSSGIYFAILCTGEKSVKQKLLLVK